MRPRSTRKGSLALLGVFCAAAAAGRLVKRPHLRPDSRRRCKVVILGAGFGGLSAALPLSKSDAIDLTVIDAQNHHLFQPLLYQVATAALSPADITSPVRDIILAAEHTRVLMGEVGGIDVEARRVVCAGRRIPYDELVIATGSQPSYLGHDEWEHYAPGLKSLHDALDLRGRLLLAFEHACTATNLTERNKLLTFVLIGGGPTGVEMAGSIAELTREMLASDHVLRAHPERS